MRRFVLTVLDDFVYDQPVYTSDVHADVLAGVDQLVVQALVDSVAGSAVEITVTLESTGDGQNWTQIGGDVIPRTGVAARVTNVAVGSSDVDRPQMSRARIKVVLGGTTPEAKVRLIVCGRDSNSAKERLARWKALKADRSASGRGGSHRAPFGLSAGRKRSSPNPKKQPAAGCRPCCTPAAADAGGSGPIHPGLAGAGLHPVGVDLGVGRADSGFHPASRADRSARTSDHDPAVVLWGGSKRGTGVWPEPVPASLRAVAPTPMQPARRSSPGSAAGESAEVGRRTRADVLRSAGPAGAVALGSRSSPSEPSRALPTDLLTPGTPGTKAPSECGCSCSCGGCSSDSKTMLGADIGHMLAAGDRVTLWPSNKRTAPPSRSGIGPWFVETGRRPDASAAVRGNSPVTVWPQHLQRAIDPTFDLTGLPAETAFVEDWFQPDAFDRSGLETPSGEVGRIGFARSTSHLRGMNPTLSLHDSRGRGRHGVLPFGRGRAADPAIHLKIPPTLPANAPSNCCSPCCCPCPTSLRTKEKDKSQSDQDLENAGIAAGIIGAAVGVVVAIAGVLNSTEDDDAVGTIHESSCDEIKAWTNDKVIALAEKLVDGPTGDDDENALLKMIKCRGCGTAGMLLDHFGKQEFLDQFQGGESNDLQLFLVDCGLLSLGDMDDAATRRYLTERPCSELNKHGVPEIAMLMQNLPLLMGEWARGVDEAA